MRNIEYLIGNENICTRPLPVFSTEVCGFLQELSSEILKSPSTRQYPDLSAAAFWCRKANIDKKKSIISDYQNRLGRGLCFHITPSNIPINFVFSFFFGMLAGNANIVRIPSKDFVQVNILIDFIKKTLEKYPDIRERTALVKYERDNEISEKFSMMADARMIWGGDKTIANIRSLKTKPRCVDITFADRYSFCIMNAESVLSLDETKLIRLVEDFYNDTFLMDQNACSSPQMIYWVNDNKDARLRFWNAVKKIAEKKYQLQDAVCVDKYTKFCEDSIDNGEIIDKIVFNDNYLYRCEIKKLSLYVDSLRGKCGYFYEYSLKKFDELFNIVNPKYQTITYFGIDPKELQRMVIEKRLNGIDRIVPIGKAMDIDEIWDGHNLIAELSRIITIG
jgi:hypothetical protein